jgi:hypothetical protein
MHCFFLFLFRLRLRFIMLGLSNMVLVHGRNILRVFFAGPVFHIQFK